MILGLTGRKGSGKDTAAAVFEANGFVNLKMAGPIKAMLATLLFYQGVDEDMVDRMIDGDLKEVPSPYLCGRTPRYAMQQLGTAWGRDLMSPDFWVTIFSNAADQFQLVVCSDVRFPNELAAMDSTYRIVRPGIDNSDGHPSETQVDELDVTGEIINEYASADQFQQIIYQLFSKGPLGMQ
jgi:hypothetical protein